RLVEQGKQFLPTKELEPRFRIRQIDVERIAHESRIAATENVAMKERGLQFVRPLRVRCIGALLNRASPGWDVSRVNFEIDVDVTNDVALGCSKPVADGLASAGVACVKQFGEV